MAETPVEDDQLANAAWIARCVGRAETSPLAETDLRELASYLSEHPAARGTLLFKQGDRPQGVWIVRSGRIELSVGAGRHRAVVYLLRAGDVEGDIPLLLDQPLPYTARAVDEVSCLLLDAGSFVRLLSERSRIAMRWLSTCAMRMAGTQRRVVQLLGRPLPQKLARLLLDEMEGERLTLPQQTLAAMLGVRRQGVNATLRELEERGLVEVGYADIRVLDRAGLEALASP